MMRGDHLGSETPSRQLSDGAAPRPSRVPEVSVVERFNSILFDQLHSIDLDKPEEPACFGDLHLDQVLASMIAGREDYDLKPFFYTPLHEAATVRYRHEVARDLEKPKVLKPVRAFAEQMRRMREHLAQARKLRYKQQKQRWFLDAVDSYCDAVAALANDLAQAPLDSRGLGALRQYLADYRDADRFTRLASETSNLLQGLAEVRYCVHVRGNRVKVSRYDDEADYSAEVTETFAKFRQGAVKDHRVKLPQWADMNHVEAQILGLVARLHPEVFVALDDFCTRQVDFVDPVIGAFDREVQFYLAYLEYIQRFQAAGLAFCYPEVTAQPGEVYAEKAFDLALANKAVPERSAVVPNDFALKGPERILVVTGPNQGGKTTFARMVGQLHYLASLGVPVPGRRARLLLPDQVFTHFEREEDLANLRGKLEDELVRIHDILGRATANSVIVMNESFASTTLRDALVVGTAVIQQLLQLGCLGVYVTFVDELASLDDATVSMVSLVAPENPALRTYKVVRKPADGLAYAAAIANKYGLSYRSLRRRIAR
jgi:DNA mismatch repair protein MutS